MNSNRVLDSIIQRYQELKDTKKEFVVQINDLQERLPRAKNTKEVRSIERSIVNAYLDIVSSTFDKRLEFEGRVIGKQEDHMDL